MNTPKHIGREQFEMLLDEKSDASIPQQVSQHLEECPHCRERLEQAAADSSWWSCLADLSNADLHSTISTARVDNRAEELDESRARSSSGRASMDLAEVLDEPSHPEMLGQLNQFEIERVIGQGGMGIVFKGFDRELHRTVAIKLMSPHLAHNATARKRFEREARAAAAVVHPNVIPIHGVSLFKGQPLIVMPLVAGASLQTQVEQNGPLEMKDVVRIGMQIAAGLAAAHDQGLIHRDIKPANILLEQDVSRVVITDFGLARAADELAMTQTGWLAGTPHYMSPEQARGVAIDPRSDLFSLGAVLYFIATGREPFRAEKPIAVLHKICHDPVLPPKQVNSDVPQTLSDFIERLLEKNPQDRFASATRVQKLLEEYLAELQQATRIKRPMKITTRRQIKRRWQIAQTAGLFALLVPIACWAGWFTANAVQPKSPVTSVVPYPNAGENRAERGDPQPEGLMPYDEFNEQLRGLGEEIQRLEQNLNFGLPADSSFDFLRDGESRNNGRHFRQKVSIRTTSCCDIASENLAVKSVDLKRMGWFQLNAKVNTEPDELASDQSRMVPRIWFWFVDLFSEQISAASSLFDN